jgi:hypothetical protein
MGGGEVFVCRLKDNDSNLYLDGSPAVLTGQEGDVMVVFLEFWYKWWLLYTILHHICYKTHGCYLISYSSFLTLFHPIESLSPLFRTRRLSKRGL